MSSVVQCWDDGLLQPEYNHSSNWFANPPLPNNLGWSEVAMTEQQANNAISYPQHGLPTYQDGALKQPAERPGLLFDYTKDWKPGTPDPEWCPVA